MSGFIYIWFDRKHKRYYIGSHWGSEDDGYVCSSTWMRNSYRRRSNDFKRRILSRIYSNRKDLLSEEQKYLNMIKPSEVRIKYYNLMLSVHKSTVHSLSVEQKKYLSECTKKQFADPEVRKKHGILTAQGMARNPIKSKSEDAKEKIRNAVIEQHKRQKENGMDIEIKKKISQAGIGRIISDKTREKLKFSQQKRRLREKNGL